MLEDAFGVLGIPFVVEDPYLLDDRLFPWKFVSIVSRDNLGHPYCDRS
jgi:hypothetical protein